MVNFVERPTEVVEYLASQFEPPSSEVLRQMLNALMEFMNSTRQWILKGHAPSEIHREEKKTLLPLPQKPFIPQSAQGTGEVIDFRTRTKVDRNDPCPCGSGKKFKRCCGKMNKDADKEIPGWLTKHVAREVISGKIDFSMGKGEHSCFPMPYTRSRCSWTVFPCLWAMRYSSGVRGENG